MTQTTHQQKDNNDWQHNEATRAGLKQFIADHKWSHAKLASRLGFTPTRITKYLNLDKPDSLPESDMPKVEAAGRHFLRHHARNQDLVGSLFENAVSKEVCAAIRQIRRTGDAGLIYSKAGRGKTCGALQYCTQNTNTLFLTVKQYSCGSNAIRRMVFEEYCHSTDEVWPGNVPKGEWLEAELRGAERIIIFDDAEFMHISGFRFAFSLHDATGLPIVFIGNREILDTLRKSDSQGKLISRIGMVCPVEAPNDTDHTARQMIARFAPGAVNDLEDEAVNVLGKLGEVRRLRKQLILAAHIREAKPSVSWSDCFSAAAGQLMTA